MQAKLLHKSPEICAAPVRRVLVVDDSRAQRKVMSVSLKRWGYDVVEAECAEDVLSMPSQDIPDLILSDWMMPGMNGPDLCKALRATPDVPFFYLVLLTSKSEKSEVALGLEAGADDFLSKPFDGTELRARLEAGERILDMRAQLQAQNEALAEALDENERLTEALNHDLREARQLQQSLLPERFKTFGGTEVSLMLQSSGFVGGDLVGVYPAGPNHIGFFAIDVSGHGISAALMTARLAGYLSAVAPEQNIALVKDISGNYGPQDPKLAIDRLNEMVLSEMNTEHYFTMILGDLDLRSGDLRLAQAGHPHPLVQRKSGEITQSSPGGFPVGLMYDAEFSSFHLKLEPGDRILFHSDGLTECPNPQGDLLSEEGLDKIADDLKDVRGPQFFDAVIWHLVEHAGDGGFPDDLSAVLVEYHRPICAVT